MYFMNNMTFKSHAFKQPHLLEGQNAGILVPEFHQKPSTYNVLNPIIPLVISDEFHVSPHPPHAASTASVGASGPEAPIQRSNSSYS